MICGGRLRTGLVKPSPVAHVDVLVADLDAAIAEADQFVASMAGPDEPETRDKKNQIHADGRSRHHCRDVLRV
jgi:hypothetical protein